MGQRWRMLDIRAFQSMNILHGVRMWSTEHHCMNNESLWWMLMDFTSLVFRKPFPKVQQFTYCMTQKGRTSLYILLEWSRAYWWARALLFAEGRLQSTSYPRSHEIRQQAPPKTWQVMYNWDLKPSKGGFKLFFLCPQFEFCRSLSSTFACEFRRWKTRSRKEKSCTIQTSGFHHCGGVLYGWSCCWLLWFPCACRRNKLYASIM